MVDCVCCVVGGYFGFFVVWMVVFGCWYWLELC